MSRRLISLAVAAATLLAACGSNDSAAPATSASTPATSAAASTTSAAAPATSASTTSGSTAPTPSTPAADITMVVYDSFPTADTPLNDALAEFTESTGIGVTLAVAGDAGTMLAKAKLTAGNPEGDVMWGVDNTLLSSALDGDVFEPYRTPELSAIDPKLTALVPNGEATPVDFGDVCINFDARWFAEHGVPVPMSLDDLTKPTYKDLLVVQNPGTSSPGLAFLLATIAKYGEDGWQDYWKALRANGVEVVDSWTTAYYDDFSGAAGSSGDRPLVVSYGSSPPAEVLGAAEPPATAPTGAVPSTCFRQVEFAGVLRGTKHAAEAQQLIDFLAGTRFQAELPLNLYVYPARNDVPLPDVFSEYAVVPEQPLTVPPSDIEANRTKWQDEWTQVVLR